MLQPWGWLVLAVGLCLASNALSQEDEFDDGGDGGGESLYLDGAGDYEAYVNDYGDGFILDGLDGQPDAEFGGLDGQEVLVLDGQGGDDITLDGQPGSQEATEGPATEGPPTEAPPKETDKPTRRPRPTRRPKTTPKPKKTSCFDPVAAKPTKYCRGTCTKGVKASTMSSAKESCVCDAGRYGRNCGTRKRRPKGSGPQWNLKWSDTAKGQVVAPPPGKSSRPRFLRGVYVVGTVGDCEDLCSQLNEGVSALHKAPCGSITTSSFKGGKTLCEVHKLRPVKACSEWLAPGAGDTKWLVDEWKPSKYSFTN